MTKTCTSCLMVLEKSDFHKNKATSDGLCYQCKDCNYRKSKKWKEENVEKERHTSTKESTGYLLLTTGLS